MSSKPDHGYDFTTLTEDLAGLIRAEMKSPVIACGQSMGGNLVMELADRFPDLVRGVVCLDGGFVDLNSQFETWPRVVETLTPPPFDGVSRDTVYELARTNYAGWPPGAAEAQLANLEIRADGTVQRRLSLSNHIAILEAMFAQRPLALAARAPRPVLVIAADEGGPQKETHIAAFVERLPNGRLVTIEGHHDLHAQHPDLVADAITGAIIDGFLA